MFKSLLQKEWIQIRRNGFVMRLVVLFPLMIMGITPWITNLEVRNVTVTIVDNDHSTLSRQIINKVEHSSYFHFNGMASSYAEAIKSVEKGQTDVVMVIPPHFEREQTLGKNLQVFIAANATNGTKGGLGSAYLANIVTSTNLNNLPPPSRNQPTITTTTLYNRHESYKVNMIPALMAMIMIMVCGFLPALNIVAEKEAGTIEQINVTPVGKMQFITAKLLPYWCIGLVVYTMCLLLAWAFYGIVPVGNIALLYLLMVLLTIIFSSIGLIVSNYSDNMQQAMLMMWGIMVCMLLLSGLFTPVHSMPTWAQTLTWIVPVRHYIDAARSVFIRGTTISGILPQLAFLTPMATIMGIWAVWSYKKNS